MDGVEELPAQDWIPGRKAGALEGGPLPGQGRALVIRDRRLDRQRDRGHFGRRPEAQVDAEGIARLGSLLQDLDDALADSDGGLPGVLAGAPRQGLRVVEEDEIEIGGVIELAAA